MPGKLQHLTSWQDAQRAIRLVRSEAAARGLDPERIGTMGFSDGGHLTYMTALSSLTNAYPAVDAIDRLSCSVQWACPIYPAYSLTVRNARTRSCRWRTSMRCAANRTCWRGFRKGRSVRAGRVVHQTGILV